MSQVSFYFALIMANYLGLFCCKYKEGEFKVSKVLKIASGVKVIVITLLTLWMFMDKFIQSKIFKNTFENIKDYSAFSIFIMICFFCLELSSSLVIGFLNFIRQPSLVALINSMKSSGFTTRIIAWSRKGQQESYLDLNILHNHPLSLSVLICI